MPFLNMAGELTIPVSYDCQFPICTMAGSEFCQNILKQQSKRRQHRRYLFKIWENCYSKLEHFSSGFSYFVLNELLLLDPS